MVVFAYFRNSVESFFPYPFRNTWKSNLLVMIVSLGLPFMSTLLEVEGLIYDVVFTLNVASRCLHLLFHNLLQFNLLFSGLSSFL